MVRIPYTTVGGDTLPSVAEACGHWGEWQAILESSPFLEGLDYLQVPPGSELLLPDGWVPAGYDAPAGAGDDPESVARAAEHVERRSRSSRQDE